MARILAIAAVLAACSGADQPDDPADAAPAVPDAEVVRAPAHLLLTEVYSQVAVAEFIEIHNPTSSAVDLTDFYISDSEAYPLLPSGAAEIDARDFVFRFPAGASLAAGATAVIARSEPDFETGYGVPADFAMSRVDDAGAMIPAGVGAAFELSDVGEVVALFHWDGSSDLVADVDLLIAGIPQPSNDLPDKTGLAVDGPDPDALATGYADDAHTMPRFDDVTTNLESYKRVALGELGETASGGNGVTGDDETSEDTARSWGQAATFGAPTPGVVQLAAPE